MIFEKVKKASKTLAALSDDERNAVLRAVADSIIAHEDELLAANADDLSRMEQSNPLYDRLQLTSQRLADIASDMRNVATLPSPLGHITKENTLPNGLRLRRISVPFGVIGMIYEARPNVTFDVFSLCFKSGNACVLKGGKDADSSNRAAVSLIHNVLRQFGISEDVVALLPATHEATAELLNAVGYVDLCIPRGGKRLINFVRDTARVPCNAKTRRVSVCNALDTLIIHSDRLADLPALCEPLAEKKVSIFADEPALAALQGSYPDALLHPATADTFGTEFMDYAMGIKTVASIEEALAHIDAHGSGHSESIITADDEAAELFRQQVDAACVYRLRQRPHLVHRWCPVWPRRRDWHQHTEAGTARPYGPRGDNDL